MSKSLKSILHNRDFQQTAKKYIRATKEREILNNVHAIHQTTGRFSDMRISTDIGALNYKQDDLGRWWHFEIIENNDLQSSPYLDDLSFDDVVAKGIVIPQYFYDRSQSSLDVQGIPGYENSTKCQLRRTWLKSASAIEILVLPEGGLWIPAGMDGKDRMIMEFDALSDFIAYLEEEMAKGNYPRHLSSDWR